MRIKLLEQKMQTSKQENAAGVRYTARLPIHFHICKQILRVIVLVNLLFCRMVGSESAEKSTALKVSKIFQGNL